MGRGLGYQQVSRGTAKGTALTCRKDLAFRLSPVCYLFGMFTWITALLICFVPHQSHATVFDAADILPPNAGAVGAMGEIVLTDPTSEGAEVHARYGLTEDWNVGVILGTGDKDKNFRFGGQGIFNLLPDWEKQLGLSFLGKALYLRRYDTGGLQLQVGPILHKRITGWTSLPANVHAGFFWEPEVRSGSSSSGTQIEVGSNFDIAQQGKAYVDAELGIKLARTDSYVLVGIGWRLGDLEFKPAEKDDDGHSRGSTKPRARGSRDGDFTDDDFKR